MPRAWHVPALPSPALRYGPTVSRATSIVPFSVLALVSSLTLALACGADDRPNLLLITVDTLRADALACYGGKTDVGIHICSIAEGGSRFQWAFSTAPYTAPSIASILTSRYPLEHGVTQHARSFLRSENETLAEVLREAGYQTAAFVSNPVLDHRKRLGQGFDHWDQEMNRQEFNRRGYVERHAIDTTSAVLTWLRQEAEAPWFVWVHFQDPHGPYAPPGAPPGRNRLKTITLPILDNDSGRGGIPAYQVMPNVTSLATYKHRYLNEIRLVDHEVGRLLRKIDELGWRPAVLLTADHGEAFGEDGYYLAHGHSVGLDQIRVPLLWRPPPGTEPGPPLVRSSVSGVDVAPTLLRAAGARTPETFSGRALQAIHTGDSTPRSIFAEGSRHAAVIQGPRYFSRQRVVGAKLRKNGEPWDDDNADLPSRTAPLDSKAGPPHYTEVGADPPHELEAALRDHLSRAIPQAGGRHSEVPQELVERLRELGYTTDE